MSTSNSPARKKLEIDLLGAAVNLTVGTTDQVEVESDSPVEHGQSTFGKTRVLRWPATTKQKRGPRITANGDVTGNAIGNYSVVNSGDAVASGPGSYANTGIDTGCGQQSTHVHGGFVTIRVPAGVEQITIKKARSVTRASDLKTQVSDKR